MAKILFLPYAEQLGSTYPLIDLAKHFVEKGDEVVFAGEGQFMKLVEASNYATEKLIEVPYALYDSHLSRGSGGFHTYETAKKHIKAELELYQKVRPDLIIAQNRPTSRLSAEIAKIKHVSVIVAMATKYRGNSIHKAESFTYAPIFKIPLIGRVFSKYADQLIEVVARTWLRPYNKIAKEYNIKPLQSFFDLLEGNLMTLIPESASIFPLKEGYPSDNYFYIGPQLTRRHFDPPHWYNEAKERDGIFIYLSMGSTAHKLYPIVFKRLVEIFGDKKGITIVTNTSWIMDGEKEHISTPSNIYVANITPAEIMFELADVTVCHGGNGTIYHSLLFGVPVVGITERVEHEMNMEKIKELNLGDYVLFNKFQKLSDQKIYDLIMNVIKDKKIKENVFEYGKKINEEMTHVDNLVDYIRGKIQ